MENEVRVSRSKMWLMQREKYKGNEAKKNKNSGKAFLNRKPNNVYSKIFKNINCKYRKDCQSKMLNKENNFITGK